MFCHPFVLRKNPFTLFGYKWFLPSVRSNMNTSVSVQVQYISRIAIYLFLSSIKTIIK